MTEQQEAWPSPAQCRAARGLLDWTIHKLARRAGVRIDDLRLFERGVRLLEEHELRSLRTTLELADITLIDDYVYGAGACLRPPRTRAAGPAPKL